MPKRGPKRTSYDDYEILSIKVDSFSAHSSASFNLALYKNDMRPNNEDELAHDFHTRLEVIGHCISPAKRAGDQYEITFNGYEIHAGEFSSTLKDWQLRDDDYNLVYKKRGDRQVPVLNSPKGIGVLSKVRGEACWTSWLFVSPRLVTDMLIQLTNISPLYLYIDERKADRKRWIRHVALQSTDPSEE